LDESQRTLHRLERLRQLNTDRNRVNENLYRLMYKEDVYILAYERIKSAPGNMTPGSDGKTIDGFSMSMIQNIIQEMRTEQFQFKPVRTVYIPKANGKKRKLGIPSTRDKIVQEVIRLILEGIYDSPHGPTSTKPVTASAQTAVAIRLCGKFEANGLLSTGLWRETSRRASTRSITAFW